MRWVKVHTHKKRRGEREGRDGGGGGRREAGFGGFPTPARALGSRGGKYLPLWGGLGSRRRRQRRLPLVGLEVVELIELEADVLDGELQQVPETGQVLGGRPGAGVHILSSGGTGRGRREQGGTESGGGWCAELVPPLLEKLNDPARPKEIILKYHVTIKSNRSRKL